MNIAQPNNHHKSATVAVALSGGVDSAVAAALLQQQGYQVTGFYMKNWTDIGQANYRAEENCPWMQDYADAQAVCQHLNIPCEIVHFEKEYRERVLAYFLEEYKNNRTPNPDVMCNTEIKFKAFLEHAQKLGFQYMATGHYARTKNNQLLRGVDPNKDQSYFIYHLNQEQLKQVLFPIGHLLKPAVRKLAQNFNLPVAKKPDSQGLCFIGDINFSKFLEQYLPHEPGNMMLLDNDKKTKIVGEHKGLAYYTIGQRYGINIGGTGPYYVVEKRVADNTLVICQGKDNPALFTKQFSFTNEHWVSGKRPAETFNCTVKVRYRSPDTACTVTKDNIVMLDKPERAITPGQFAVFYQDDVVLGGGVIV
ncbi:MAG: tRNA 2-thiouridine(34) synthase MnmA [Patescibacteria group bacterium]|jgi:tRNA-specific 2-thiouridylase